MILRQPVDPNLVEIRWDGAVYMPGAWYRKILNDAFGPGGWRVLPLGNPYPDGKDWGMHAALIAEGRVVAVTFGEHSVNQRLKQVTRGVIYESLCTDAITKCCKTLGVAEELWFPSWTRKFIHEHGEQVWDAQSERRVWRRKDDNNSYHIGKPGYDHQSEYRKPQRVEDENNAHIAEISRKGTRALADRDEYDSQAGFQSDGRED